MVQQKQCVGRSQPFVEVQSPPVVAQRAPATSDTNYPKGTTWLDETQSPATNYIHVGGGVWTISTSAYATSTAAGIVELSTAAEMTTGTSSTLVPAVDVVRGFLDGIVQVDTVTVSSAELLALATTPVELVAAPGAGNYIEFLGAHFILDYATTQYTESGDNMGIKYTDASGVQVSSTIECTGFIDQAADTITSAIPAADAIVAASAAVNKALVLDNLLANFAAGDSTMSVIISYRVVASGL